MNQGFQVFFKSSILSKEEEENLFRNKLLKESTDRLVQSHARMVLKSAFQYRGYGIPIDDLVQEGMIGLIKSIGKFNPEYGTRFSTYARWWIRAGIQYYILCNINLIKNAFFRQKIIKDYTKTWSIIQNQFTDSDKCEMKSWCSFVSLDELQRYDQISDNAFDNFEADVITSYTQDKRISWLKKMLSKLEPVEAKIVTYLFFENRDKYDFQELGKKISMTPTRAHVLFKRTIRKLKYMLVKQSQNFRKYS